MMQTALATCVKALPDDDSRVGGYLVVWGSRTERDLHQEYFTQETDFALDWYQERPVLYQHGMDDRLKTEVIGRIDRVQPDEVGIWAEAQLDLRHRYGRKVQQLVDQGILNWSSGSLGHLVKVAEDGRILRWPLIEGSLTPAPAEPRRTDVQTIKSAYAVLGLDTARFDPIDRQGMVMPEELILPTKTLPLASQHDARRLSITSEYDQLSAEDMLYGYLLLRAGKGFKGVSERYANALAEKVRGAGWSATKADELSYSTQTTYGDEWVPDVWSSQLWQKARQDNVILPLFRSIEMPSNPFELPIEGTDPTVYYVPETSNEAQLALGSGNPIPDSKIGSGKVQLTAKKLALRVGFSSELVEDSIIPVLNIYREQAVRAIANSIDYALLNGDTETGGTGNINSDAAAPASTERYLMFDGMRKLPLVTNTALKVDMGNVAPTLAKLREARFKMATRYSARPSDLAWIVDGGTYAKLLSLTEFLTMDKAGVHATAQTGQIGFMDGIPVFVSAEMPLTEADGKVGNTTNDRGTAVCVYRPAWYVGYRRKVAVSVDYLPYYDSYQLTATVRLAFARFDTGVASALYNIAL